jgi:hydrogenase expression/formation protein HypC
MCLGIPGRIEEIYKDGSLLMGKVSFDGVTMPVCLETTPEAGVGDYAIVHAGFSLSLLNELEAVETLKMIREMEALQAEEDRKTRTSDGSQNPVQG